jgi:hypothetical protein
MSLEEIAKRPRRQAPFCFEFGITKTVLWESGKPALGFPLFHGLTAAVGMWESRLRFPRAVGAEGNLLLVFLRVHGPAFPPPSFLMRSSFVGS